MLNFLVHCSGPLEPWGPWTLSTLVCRLWRHWSQRKMVKNTRRCISIDKTSLSQEIEVAELNGGVRRLTGSSRIAESAHAQWHYDQNSRNVLISPKFQPFCMKSMPLRKKVISNFGPYLEIPPFLYNARKGKMVKTQENDLSLLSPYEMCHIMCRGIAW